MSQTEEIEIGIQEARQAVALGRSFTKLLENKDFASLIMEGYFKDEAIRLVHLRGDPSMRSDADQASIVTSIDAIGNLAQYFRKIEMFADMANSAIQDGEQALEEINAEELS